MAIIYKQDGSIGSPAFNVTLLHLRNEDVSEPLFIQEVIGPAILRHANAVRQRSVPELLNSAVIRLAKFLLGDQQTTLHGIAFPER